MPLDQRYVVAAFNAEEDRLAFVSATLEWVQSARKAAVFQSQMDANYFIKKNSLAESTAAQTPELSGFDHVRPVYVRVEIKITSPEYDPDNPDRGISFSGMG